MLIMLLYQLIKSYDRGCFAQLSQNKHCLIFFLLIIIDQPTNSNIYMTLNKVCYIWSTNTSKRANTLWSERMKLSFAKIKLFKYVRHYTLNEEDYLCLSYNTRSKLSNLNTGEFVLYTCTLAIFEAFGNSKKNLLNILRVF